MAIIPAPAPNATEAERHGWWQHDAALSFALLQNQFPAAAAR
jgi:hypothetical protein